MCHLLFAGRAHVAAGSSSDQLLCLNDLFATCAELSATSFPDNAAEDSFSFLPAHVDKEAKSELRRSLVSHSVHGEFAYREKNWKLVFKMPGGHCISRGKPAVVELYNLNDDVAEKHDVADSIPRIVQQLTRKRLQSAIVEAAVGEPTDDDA